MERQVSWVRKLENDTGRMNAIEAQFARGKSLNQLSFYIGDVCVCFSRLVMSDSLRPPWTIAGQAPLSMEFSR